MHISAQQHLHPIVSSLREKLLQKTSLLLISEILRMFVNTLNADDKYSLNYREKLLQPIQMDLFQK